MGDIEKKSKEEPAVDPFMEQLKKMSEQQEQVIKMLGCGETEETVTPTPTGNKEEPAVDPFMEQFKKMAKQQEQVIKMLGCDETEEDKTESDL
jgi:hypothetical protein